MHAIIVIDSGNSSFRIADDARFKKSGAIVAPKRAESNYTRRRASRSSIFFSFPLFSLMIFRKYFRDGPPLYMCIDIHGAYTRQ